MPANSPIPNQANSQSNNNFNIDIAQIYSDFITEIDATRSIINIQVNQSKLSSFKLNTIAGINATLHAESTSQESRIHAFYRLIGFPVVANDMSYYNPGLDTISGTKTIDPSKKITIANSPITGFNVFSLQRENYANRWAGIFAQSPPTIDSTVLALSSSVNTRKFAVPVSSTDPFDVTPADQTYTANIGSQIGTNNIVSLNQYVDALGNTTGLNLASPRYHFIKPLIVDARIDLSVNPASRRIGVPFVPTKQNLLISEGVYVKRPLIEKIVRDRFGQNQGTVISAAQQASIDYILNVETVQNDSVVQKTLSYINGVSGVEENALQQSFQKYLFMIQAMCIRLVEAQIKIQKVQSRYYWLPLPSATGPEGGSNVADPIVSQTLPNGTNFSFITTNDQNIIDNILISASNNLNAQTAPLNAQPSLGPFAFDSFKTFDTDTTSSFGDNAGQELTTLLKRRTHDLNEANSALQTIEIIMGEWSGLGLCDIIAIMGSLYITNQDSILGFLDDDAYARMLVALNLQSNPPPRGNISSAQSDLIQNLQFFYNLMDDIYLNISKNTSKYSKT